MRLTVEGRRNGVRFSTSNCAERENCRCPAILKENSWHGFVRSESRVKSALADYEYMKLCKSTSGISSTLRGCCPWSWSNSMLHHIYLRSPLVTCCYNQWYGCTQDLWCSPEHEADFMCLLSPYRSLHPSHTGQQCIPVSQQKGCFHYEILAENTALTRAETLALHWVLKRHYTDNLYVIQFWSSHAAQRQYYSF